MAREQDSLRWSSQFNVAPPQRTPKLPGDKITLPQSALEQLLAAAPLSEPTQSSARPYTSTFDPFNPHTFAAESQARAQGLDRQTQLPHPLTFRLVNPQNDRVIYAGIREFSAADQEIGLSAFLRRALGIDDDRSLSQTQGRVTETETGQSMDAADTSTTSESGPTITVHANQLPKGTYVRLRPLEAGYDPEDWKALLERHLRDNFTTLTTGELLTVSVGREETFRFLVDRVEPEGDAICVVDTDLEVDIVALTEDQARETLRRRVEKASRAPGAPGASSVGGVLARGETVVGQVIPDEYVDYELRSWDREEPIEVEVEGEDDADVYLFASPFSSRQRNRPRADEHVFADFSGRPLKRIRIQPTNVELDGAETLYLSVHAFAQSGADAEQQSGSSQTLPLRYNLRVVQGPSAVTGAEGEPDAHDPDDVQCKNCHQWVPQRTLVLHENFCLRNNVLCPQCGNVFQKRSPEWRNHWHCPHDPSHGNDASSKHRHDSIFHTKCLCSGCGFEADELPRLAQHRTTVCPAKPILCQFCHLVVPQKGETDPDMHDPEVLLSGLTPHELVDGGRTTECHLCNKIIRLRDMKTHLRHHDLERLSRPAPRICLNQNCGRTLDARGVQSAITPGTDTLGLCSICFGPLYVDTYDPEGKSLRRRIERRYLSQLMSGCGKTWCQNEYCKTGKQQRGSPGASVPQSMSAADILTLVRPLIDAINLRRDAPNSNTAPFYLCTDQTSQQRRILAEMIAAEGPTTGAKEYDLPWCVAAVEAATGNPDKAREWLGNWAPAKGEDRHEIR